MDHIYLKQLARLKFTMRRANLGTVDLERFEANAQYARRVLETAEQADAEDLVSLAVELRHKRGLLAGTVNAPEEFARHIDAVTPVRKATKTAAVKPAATKYMFGARS